MDEAIRSIATISFGDFRSTDIATDAEISHRASLVHYATRAEFSPVVAKHGQLMNVPYKDFHWAKQNIQNLNVAMQDLLDTGTLASIRNIQGPVLERVEAILHELSGDP